MKNNEYLLDYVRKLAEVIMEQSTTTDDEVYWEYETLRDDLTPELITPLDFYKGTAGIAFFLRQLNHELRDPQITSLLEQVRLWPSKSIDRNLYKGFFNGFYGNAYIGLLRDSGNDEIWQFITEESEQNIREFDIISGHSGSIIALLMILRDADLDREQALLIIGKIKVHLKFMLRDLGVHAGHVVFKRPDSEVWGGFSHGQQGVEYVLRLLSELSDEMFALNLAESIASFEEKTFDDEIGNYLDIRSRFRHEPQAKNASLEDIELSREDKMNMHAWCHGLPGIAGAVQMTAKASPLRVERSVRNGKAMYAQLDFFLEDDRKCLCHGTAGNLDYFLDDPSGFSDFMETIQPHLSELFHDYENSQYIQGELGKYDCSLMTGLSGIAYFFLRLYDPQQFRSILFPLNTTDMHTIRSKYRLEKSLDLYPLGENGHLTGLQNKLIHQLKTTIVTDVGECSFAAAFDWEIRKDEFRSFFDRDYRFLHEHTVKSNNELLQDRKSLYSDHLFLDFQKSLIFQESSGKLYFFYSDDFHETEVSELEIEIFRILEKERSFSMEKLLELVPDKEEASEFVTQLAQFGFVKIRLVHEGD